VDPGRWRHIERLYHAALDRPAREREAFLETECRGDEDLRLEVQALLSRATSAVNVLARPSAVLTVQMSQPADPVLTGRRLGVYEVQTPIGAGGMGVVYRALDTNLNRPVAIKVLSDELANPAARRRFQREAQTASSLNHPHILTVHDAGEFEGRQYLVTELVEGGTLRDWTRGAKRGWRQTIELLTGVADGLAAAHQAGILHRDIKPENILITKSGYAKLADFGLAKLHEGAPSDEAPTVTDMRTRPGVIVGTAAYMSPEQAVGQPVDARSDIFSFGVVLYEALAGRRPFTGASDLDVVHAIAHRAADPLPDDVPLLLRMVVGKALEKDPADRFQSMRDMVVDLRRVVRQSAEAPPAGHVPMPESRRARHWLAAGAAFVVLASAGALLLSRFWRPTDGARAHATSAPSAVTPTQIRSVAVLPLENRSGDPKQDYFVEGMHEALITDLARIGLQKVIAKPSADAFKGTRKPLRDIGRELGVEGLVTGSVMRVDDRIQITTQLVSADSGVVLWANRYERNAGDVLSLQNELVGAIAREVRATLSAEQTARLATAGPIDPGAHDAYLKARSLFASFTNSADTKYLDAAIAQYEQAIQVNPTYAPSYAGLSQAYVTASQGSWRPPKDTFPKARAAALKAVELDEQLAAAHAALAEVFLWYDWNWTGADREIQRALQLNPDSVDALTASQNYLTLVAGRSDDAARTSQRILEVDPLDPFARVQPVWVSFFSRRYDESIAKAKTLVELSPNNLMGPWFLAASYAVKRMGPEVVAQCRRVMDLLSGAFVMQAIAECAANLGIVGQTTEARRLLRRLEHPPPGIWLDPVPMGDAYAGVGDIDRAVEWYKRGVDERSPNMIYLKVDSAADAVRRDPRFQELLRQMNFP
jgi:serine/threonine protein kinase/TolB-like protein